jgi:hypothetical protein
MCQIRVRSRRRTTTNADDASSTERLASSAPTAADPPRPPRRRICKQASCATRKVHRGITHAKVRTVWARAADLCPIGRVDPRLARVGLGGRPGLTRTDLVEIVVVGPGRGELAPDGQTFHLDSRGWGALLTLSASTRNTCPSGTVGAPYSLRFVESEGSGCGPSRRGEHASCRRSTGRCPRRFNELL